MVRVLIISTLIVASGCNTSDQDAKSRSAANQLSDAWQSEFAQMDQVADSVVEALHHAESMELIFLVPDENYSPPRHVEGKEYFNWWITTGRTTLNADDRKRLSANLLADIETHRHQPYADCFEPHHALRVHASHERYIDIILCLKCKQLWCFDKNGNRMKSATGISDQLQPLLDSLRPE